MTTFGEKQPFIALQWVKVLMSEYHTGPIVCAPEKSFKSEHLFSGHILLKHMLRMGSVLKEIFLVASSIIGTLLFIVFWTGE